MSLMGSMQFPLICPANADLDSTSVKACLLNGSGFRGIKLINRVSISDPHHSQRVRNMVVNCSSSLYPSSNESNNSKPGNFKQDDTVYVNATVFEAAEMRSSSDGFMVMMKDGKLMRCVYSYPHNRHRPHFAQNPVFMLKFEDGTDRLLPIFVPEMPIRQLVAPVNDVQVARPSMYEVVDEMITKMGYVINFARLTDRAFGSYFAQLYLTKVGGEEADNISFDLQPLDAIKLAVNCKAPIEVNKNLACSDGLRVTEFAKAAGVQKFSKDELFSSILDRPTDNKPCVDAKEFNLLRNMLVAVVEERYHDAAVWRDELNRLRSTWLWMFV